MKKEENSDTKNSRRKIKSHEWVKNQALAWADAAEKNEVDVFDLNNAPEWVLNAYVEVVKVVMPGGKLPPAKEWDAEMWGLFLGRLHGFQKLYNGEVPLGPETKAEMENLKAFAKKKHRPKNFKAIVEDFATKFIATDEAISAGSVTAVNLTYDDAKKYFNGLARGMEIGPEELVTLSTFKRHTRTYWVLARSWRACMNCRSLKHLHQILCGAVGENRIGNFRTFEKLCQKIGLTIRKRGRPPTQK